MKKILLGTLFVVGAVLAVEAEGLKFVTTLSQPVGVFKNVEAVNAANTSTIHSVNFCYHKVSNPGVINSKKTTVMTNLTLDNNATLASDSSVGDLTVTSFELWGKDDLSRTQLNDSTKASLIANSLQASGKTPATNKGVKILLTNGFFGDLAASMKSVVASLDNMNIKVSADTGAVYADGVVSTPKKTGQWEKIACADGEKDLTTDDGKKCADTQQVLIVK